tara:strand:- start:595 stop:1065 length:471 start_codon:yes stop_codon:yes gene_type:complete
VIRVTRFISYYKLKLARLPASPHAIAAGFACGSMVSFTPLLGLHFLLAIVFAYIIRGNYVAALLGTIVGNPITFPFIWGLIYKVGALVTSNKQKELNHEINIDMIITQTYEIFLPMLLGGAILAIPVWLITYLLTHSFVSSYKKSKLKKNKNLKGN